ncbi:hypothetical protein PMAYCL1PPCAC_15565, partial [Pristionchus mayeri]
TSSMRFILVLFAIVSVVSSIKCYDGLVEWGRVPKDAKLTLKNCRENCCVVTWSLPGTIYSCGNGCPKANEFIGGEKCESAPVDSSWCHCAGPVGKCKPK